MAQFVTRFGMRPDAELVDLCAACDLSAIPGERQLEEFRKLLLLGERPAAGLQCLKRAELLRFFPELGALVDVPQDPQWHEEGDVWSHTLLAVDAALDRVMVADVGQCPPGLRSGRPGPEAIEQVQQHHLGVAESPAPLQAQAIAQQDSI